jgi:glycosyltransferase involved in cell wall biosynthesis
MRHPLMKDPLISVVVCAHRTDRYGDLVEAINSLKSQTYRNVEIICVFDGNRDLCEKFTAEGQSKGIQVILNHENLGLSESRNRGAAGARGSVIAFFDDDAVADVAWAEQLVQMYALKGALAAGGRILPLWTADKPVCLPEEYYWLIGATHKGFPNEVAEVRNTFGSNLSFRRDIFAELGGFKVDLGFKGAGLIQGEEVEICNRMRERFGRGVIYNPGAVVYHKVFRERLRMKYLLSRAFWQGYSKRELERRGYSLAEEGRFLVLLKRGVIQRIKAPSPEILCQAAVLMALTLSVGFGYLYGAMAQKNLRLPASF